MDRNLQDGYLSFASDHSKALALEQLANPTVVGVQYEIQDYDITSHMTSNWFPFTGLLVAAYRPSIHSAGKLVMHLVKHGALRGHVIHTCPYDADRAFMYVYYPQGTDVIQAINYDHTIPGHMISHDFNQCSEDVEIWKYSDNDLRRYGLQVSVKADEPITDPRTVQEVVSYLARYGGIESLKVVKSDNNTAANGHERSPVQLYINFIKHRSVFKIFYEKSFFGQVRVPLESGIELSLTASQVTHYTRELYTLEVHNVPRLDPETDDLLAYCSELLDTASCNPGIIAGIYVPTSRAFYLRLPQPWYVKDVSCKLYQFLRSHHVPKLYQGLEVRVRSHYWKCELLDKVLTERESQLNQ